MTFEEEEEEDNPADEPYPENHLWPVNTDGKLRPAIESKQLCALHLCIALQLHKCIALHCNYKPLCIACLRQCVACGMSCSYWRHGLCNNPLCVDLLNCCFNLQNIKYRCIYTLLGHAMPSVLVCASHNMYVYTHRHNHLMFIQICGNI